MRVPAFFTIAALAIAPGIAHAAEPACLTPGEFSSLAAYALPSAISGTAKRCTATLAPSAFLRKNGSDLVSRYSAQKQANWPGAKAAFLKISSAESKDANALFAKLPDQSLMQMADLMVEGMVEQNVPTEKCAAIDSAIRLLAPLPPANTAELIAVTVGLTSKAGKASIGKFSLCES